MTVTLSVDSIPHRPPFLFVDEVVEVERDRIVTKKLADPEAEFFRGHYPGNPVMPGVLLCECCFQAGALLIAHRLGDAAKDGTPVITRIRDARFKRIVKPGDDLTIEVSMDEELDGAYFLTGRMTVNERAIMRVTFACMLVDREEGAS
jgi:3-hydroxyacyl-[acyl-carrier-protein] dehydratase